MPYGPCAGHKQVMADRRSACDAPSRHLRMGHPWSIAFVLSYLRVWRQLGYRVSREFSTVTSFQITARLYLDLWQRTAQTEQPLHTLRLHRELWPP